MYKNGKPKLKHSCKLYNKGKEKCNALKETYCNKEERCSFYINVNSDKVVDNNVY